MNNALEGKTLLLLGASGKIGSPIAFKWALEGIRMIGIGSCRKVLEQIQREVEDTRGSFRYLKANLREDKEIHQVIEELVCNVQPIDFVINLIGEYGCSPITPSVLLSPQNGFPPTEETIQRFYHAWRQRCHTQNKSNHHTNLLSGLDVPVIDVICFHGGVGQDLPSSASISLPRATPLLSAVPTRWMTLYLQEAIAPRSHPTDLPPSTWIDQVPDRIPPALIVDETVRLLANPLDAIESEVVLRAENRGVYRINLARPETSDRIADCLPVVVKPTSMERGVFARQAFLPGDLVLRSAGRVLPYQTEHSIQIDWNRHLEPDPPIRFINHSCDPNVGIKTNVDGLPDFYALKPIAEDDEITFDYAMSEFDHQKRDNPNLEFDLTCQCGTAICRGKLGYYSELSEACKQKYQGFISAYLLA